ncbi:DNA mismatch repair protein MutS [Streptomyces sp. NPDC052036]|uniref:DNA mismatch repair protein MutS n=1 Tax=Streptomyces sp. NPDC052036 TaxID=3155171 RepID=UPI003418BC25
MTRTLDSRPLIGNVRHSGGTVREAVGGTAATRADQGGDPPSGGVGAPGPRGLAMPGGPPPKQPGTRDDADPSDQGRRVVVRRP